MKVVQSEIRPCASDVLPLYGLLVLDFSQSLAGSSDSSMMASRCG